jgi:3-dehydroquinate synthase
MNSLVQEIQVAFRYTVHFTAGVFDSSNPLLSDLLNGASAIFVLDRGVARAHRGLPAAIKRYCGGESRVVIVPGGEKIKNQPRYVKQILRAINDAGLCRHSYIVAIGGGAVLDAAGYAAATAHRGIRLVRIPTTVLAQDDSGVGVKNGVNAFGKKNYLGTFAPPFAVINDFAFLATLSDRDWRAGISEAVKVALIKDAALFDSLERDAPLLANRDAQAMEQLIRRCAALHCAHIATSGDPFELGSSRPLDFGHWAAHKLEQLTNYRIRHGEAVAIGIALDTTYSYLSGWLAESEWRRVLELLQQIGLKLYVPELGSCLGDAEHTKSVLRGLAEFREHLGGQLTIMMLRAIGQPFDVHEMDTGTVARSIEILKQLQERRRAAAVMENGYADPERVA